MVVRGACGWSENPSVAMHARRDWCFKAYQTCDDLVILLRLLCKVLHGTKVSKCRKHMNVQQQFALCHIVMFALTCYTCIAEQSSGSGSGKWDRGQGGGGGREGQELVCTSHTCKSHQVCTSLHQWQHQRCTVSDVHGRV
jgi:hypothetical protein